MTEVFTCRICEKEMSQENRYFVFDKSANKKHYYNKCRQCYLNEMNQNYRVMKQAEYELTGKNANTNKQKIKLSEDEIKEGCKIFVKTLNKSKVCEYFGCTGITLNKWITSGKFDNYLPPEFLEYLKDKKAKGRLTFKFSDSDEE